ncbi:mitochondrial integral membrane protein [Saitoella complicata NRRL Y-17804]|uniref:mitochondrial integral membrane protein n=1 Tax=Saitoella complicata (strain BCRC 22490 / CBS 7301 / JCM 7358 / NBRC 10748 / NRRL Y-17804) TaxID=698492 RepID=UPI000867C59A|nr:mitochondrial integral membrane protein [Saitoella complicata NRRL Y-17804]ODQ55472.1 mitochondrial integral membrane protein [Saitoella complicata NRRL Y-17804]
MARSASAHEGPPRSSVSDNDDDFPASVSEAAYAEGQINERSRLLGPNGQRRPLLSPDDEAVSPMNMFLVRALRTISFVLLLISSIWALLLFVNVFVAIPGLSARASGYTAFIFAVFSVTNLVINLLFFTTPSKGDRLVSLTISVFLLACAVFILVVPRLRLEEGWVGIATVFWAALIGAWTVVTDRVVEWGKQEEEERLTGRVETRRTLGEWFKVSFTLTSLLVLFGLVFLTAMGLVLRAHDATLAPPGQRYYVDNRKYQVHLNCYGDAKPDQPTVLIEAGETSAYYLNTWVAEAQSAGDVGRVCYWDRPGFGWSDSAPSPLSAGMAVDVLSQVLTSAREDGPFVIVAHGVGGLYSRIFASRHVPDIKGLLLIDTLHEDLLGRIASSRHGFMAFLRGLWSPLSIDRLFGWIFRGRSREDRIYGRSAWRDGKVQKALLQENLAAKTLTHNEIIAARAILPANVPISVVTSGRHIKRDKAWESKQRDLAGLSEQGTWDIANTAGHIVWRDDEGRDIVKKRLAALVSGTVGNSTI